MPFVKPTGEEIRLYRDQEECGIAVARKVLYRQALLKAIEEAQTLDDVKEALKLILVEFCG